jgi:transcriptional regulator with XRE-family HTH domain
MTKDVDAFWDWVDRRSEEVGIVSFRELENRSGFSHGAIGRRKNNHKFPTVEMAEGMCHALKVDWVKLWSHAGFVDEYSPEKVQLTADQLTGLDAEIYYALRDTGDDFKQAVLKTIKTWLVLYEELRK